MVRGLFVSLAVLLSSLTPALAADSFQLLRYNSLMSLSEKDQHRVLEAFQDALARLDADGSDVDSAALEEWLLLVEQADADDGPQFCINLGVVQPLKDCDSSKGAHMHDFDTKPLLKDLGDAANHCAKSAMPCSPAFGFDANGSLFCSSKNKTRDCAAKAQADKKKTELVDVFKKCGGAKGSAAPIKADCKKLQSFYEGQVKLVGDLCKKSPDTKACGILRGKLDEILEAQGKHALPTETQDGEGSGDVAKVVNGLANANQAVQMKSATANCPPGSKASATSGNPAKCIKADFPKNRTPTFEILFIGHAQLPDGQNCLEASVPGQGVVTINRYADDAVSISYQKSGMTAAAQAVVFKNFDPGASVIASDLIAKKVPAGKLLDATAPVSAITDRGVTTIKNEGKSYQGKTRGWTTTDGTEIKYLLDDKTNSIAVDIRFKNGQELTDAESLDDNSSPSDSKSVDANLPDVK
jgi:hypothetical protein